MFKKQTKKGSVAMTFALLFPIILIVLFVGIDFLHITAERNAAQRKVDSAALTAAILASPNGDVIIDSDGYIVNIPTTDPSESPSTEADEDKDGSTKEKVCVIKQEHMDQALAQLTSQFTVSEIEVKNISTDDQMENGVVRIQAKGYVENLWIDFLLPDHRFPYVVEGYAVCSYTQKS